MTCSVTCRLRDTPKIFLVCALDRRVISIQSLNCNSVTLVEMSVTVRARSRTPSHVHTQARAHSHACTHTGARARSHTPERENQE